TDDDVIENVRLGNLNKTSACSPNGYANYTGTDTATLISGANNPIVVTTGDNWTEQVGVWIDYDRSGSFEAAEFTNLGSTAAGSGGVHSGAIVVPGAVTNGYTRMRVRVRFATALAGTNACLAYTFGETEDYTVNITPCVVSSVTTQPPATTSISCSGTGTIRATIAGSLNQYQWQVLVTGAGAVWTDLTNNATYSGVTTNTLTITNALPALNGNQYRVRYQGACTSPSVTTASTLTVGALVPTVSNTLPINRCTTAPPTLISIATPVGLASLSTTASGTLNTNIPDDNDETVGENDNFITSNLAVNNIPAGATITGFNVKLNIRHSWVGDLVLVLKAPDGKTINLAYALTATGGPGPSTAFTNTVISSTGVNPLSSGTNPYTGTFRLDNAGPSTPGFTPTGPLGFDPNTTVLADMYQGNGTWTLALYDYFQDNQTTNFLENWELNISYLGQTTATFSPVAGLFTDAAGTIAYTGQSLNTVYANPTASTVYAATVNTAICGAGTVSVPVNVGSPLSGTSAVASVTGCVGGSATFTSTAPTGGLNATYQWQDSTVAGVSWTNIAGATAATYTINGLTTAISGNKYRVVRTVASCSSTLTSTPGTLTVAPLPVLTLTTTANSLYPGQTATLSVTSSTTVGANGYTWYRNGVVIPGVTGNTLLIDVDGIGEYTVTVADANGCGSATPGSVTISSSPNDILFIYPSPNSGQFQVRYQSAPGNTPLPRVVNIYDSKGARVYSKTYSVAVPYTRMDVDMSGFQKGVYQVELTDRNGERLKTGRVMIL
ncbi:MAG: T9SS type A sorting domain-containing protein, partial [Rhizobacter sp.]|nr:T9SS type A sorting domain-containing protein [Ferruginibacter sp.]